MIDEIDRMLLEALSKDARMSIKALAIHTGLSSPSTAERLRKLEERGVIKGYYVDVDPAAIGYLFEAVVRIRPLPGNLHIVQQLIQDMPAITSCDKVTGDDCFVAKLQARSMLELDALLDKISTKASTNTSIVKSRTVERRALPLFFST